jgi:hypothetical protein
MTPRSRNGGDQGSDKAALRSLLERRVKVDCFAASFLAIAAGQTWERPRSAIHNRRSPVGTFIDTCKIGLRGKNVRKEFDMSLTNIPDTPVLKKLDPLSVRRAIGAGIASGRLYRLPCPPVKRHHPRAIRLDGMKTANLQ